MNAVFRQTRSDAVVTEDGAFECAIVGEHREHDAAGRGGRRSVRDRAAFPCEFFGTRARSIVDGHVVSGFDEITRHGAAHGAETDESDFLRRHHYSG